MHDQSESTSHRRWGSGGNEKREPGGEVSSKVNQSKSHILEFYTTIQLSLKFEELSVQKWL
jgi:hypothetical protein